MGEQAAQETREIGEGQEESFTSGAMTWCGPVLSRYGRLEVALEEFQRQVEWLDGYLFVVSEHFASRDSSIPASTVAGYLDAVPGVVTDVRAALEDVEHLAAELRGAMAGEAWEAEASSGFAGPS